MFCFRSHKSFDMVMAGALHFSILQRHFCAFVCLSPVIALQTKTFRNTQTQYLTLQNGKSIKTLGITANLPQMAIKQCEIWSKNVRPALANKLQRQAEQNRNREKSRKISEWRTGEKTSECRKYKHGQYDDAAYFIRLRSCLPLGSMRRTAALIGHR